MSTLLENFEATYRKPKVTKARSGDTVRVHQRIVEGGKERTQVFEGLVIRTHRQDSLTATLTVRRIASGIGVEKTFMMHAPNIEKIEVVRRSKVRRNYLSHMRGRFGKSARLSEVGFDREGVNVEEAEVATAEEVGAASEEQASEGEAKTEAKESEEKPAEEVSGDEAGSETKDKAEQDQGDKEQEAAEKSKDDKSTDKAEEDESKK